MDEGNAQQLKARGFVVLLVCDVPILQRRIAGESTRPSLTGQGSAVAELAQVWEARRARYLAVADLTYDVSLESADSLQDLRGKAAAIQKLLQQSNAFSRNITVQRSQQCR
jgi:shikimate kinase